MLCCRDEEQQLNEEEMKQIDQATEFVNDTAINTFYHSATIIGDAAILRYLWDTKGMKPQFHRKTKRRTYLDLMFTAFGRPERRSSLKFWCQIIQSKYLSKKPFVHEVLALEENVILALPKLWELILKYNI